MVAKGVYEQAVVVAHDVGVGRREVRELLREAVVVASDACRDGFLGGERDQGQVGARAATELALAALGDGEGLEEPGVGGGAGPLQRGCARAVERRGGLAS